MIPRWQSDRGQLNHNWLQNGVLIALNHALSVAYGAVRPRDAHKTLSDDIGRWPERRMELLNLLDRFESEMSPRIYFDCLPLSRCPAETREWLESLTHELWLHRTGGRGKILTAKRAYLEADSAFVLVVSALTTLPDAPTPEDLRVVGAPLQAFIARCTALAETISALPQRISCC